MNTAALYDIEVKNLIVKKGKTQIIKIDSLEVYPGEILAIIGPNGSGKTSLMNVLSLLEKPFSGELYFKGERVDWSRPLFPLRRRMGVVFQLPLLFDTTVYNNISTGLKFKKIKTSERKPLIEAVLRQMGILHLSNRSARKLSGGEASRVSLARAFVLKPEILFLDEPFHSLDPPTRESLLNDLEKTLQQTRTTAVFITHDFSEAIRIAHRIAVMSMGSILQIGPTDQVVNFPNNELIASFVGTETVLSGKVLTTNGTTFTAAIGDKEIEATGTVNPGQEIILCIRPENVMLSIDAPQRERVSVRNFFPATVKKIISLGSHYKVYLECGFPLTAYVTKNSLENLDLKNESRVIAQFKATAIHVIIRKS